MEFFVFQEDATVEYGDFVMDVARGQMKFNIEGASWPFCGTDHRLEITLNIRVPGDRPPKEIQQRPEEVVGDQARMHVGGWLCRAPLRCRASRQPEARPNMCVQGLDLAEIGCAGARPKSLQDGESLHGCRRKLPLPAWRAETDLAMALTALRAPDKNKFEAQSGKTFGRLPGTSGVTFRHSSSIS